MLTPVKRTYQITRHSEKEFSLTRDGTKLVTSNVRVIWKVVGELMMKDFRAGEQPVCLFPPEIGPVKGVHY